MPSDGFHLSDQELLLAVDGELPASRLNQVTEHLAACWDCRARRVRMEGAIASFVEARHNLLDPRLPPEAGRRALLKAHLPELASGSQPGLWAQFRRGPARHKSLAAGVAAAMVLTVAALGIVYRSRNQISSHGGVLTPLEPSRKLTPGAVRQVNLRDVCGAPRDEDQVRVVPASLQHQVFQEYGIEGARPKDYEVDFLITPELGGSNDIHNLWPESYYSTVWNAHVKDELEDLLHAKVCSGEVDLNTAQRDISSDWISAYKKYFHTDKPL